MFLLGYFRGAATCQWGKVAVMVWDGDGINCRGWGGLMLWWSQNQHTNQGQVKPNWNINRSAHDNGIFSSAYTLLY